jgi:hypothetical protein
VELIREELKKNSETKKYSTTTNFSKYISDTALLCRSSGSIKSFILNNPHHFKDLKFPKKDA